MKKVLLLLTFCLIAAAAAVAQNANRNGCFMEVAVGGTTGTTPQTSYGILNGNLTVFHAHGTSVNFTMGARRRISSYAAYEFALELQSPTDAFKTQPVAKLMPLSFRFTTPEFWRNFSFYINFRLGGAIGNKGKLGYMNPYYSGPSYILENGNNERRDVPLFEEVSGGAAYQLGFGVNLSNHFYVGFSWDAQYMFNQYRNDKTDNLHWGMAGLLLGYRF